LSPNTLEGFEMSDERPRLAWGHININVRDLDRSVAFYEKLGFEAFMSAIPYLGLDEGPVAKELSSPSARVLGLPASTKGRACIMQLGRTFPKLDLTEWDESSGVNPLTNADAGIVRICLASQDLVADHARLSEAGVEFLTAPEGCEDGLAEIALCRDPDGTLIELIEVHLERWPSPPKGS
jgi:catechol 2,3-dioxygenase-like lactoylglutathione lyase family enzyme